MAASIQPVKLKSLLLMLVPQLNIQLCSFILLKPVGSCTCAFSFLSPKDPVGQISATYGFVSDRDFKQFYQYDASCVCFVFCVLMFSCDVTITDSSPLSKNQHCLIDSVHMVNHVFQNFPKSLTSVKHTAQHSLA